MRIHYLQHVPFEDLGSMRSAFVNKGHQLSATHLYLDATFPSMIDFDWLIIMGGPMGVYDEATHSWLSPEKIFIREAIQAGKKIIGICLGAQLIADVLGAKVYKNKYREIGWFNLKRTIELENTIFSQTIPDNMEVFHWHGDTFDLPKGAVLIGSSAACRNQGFVIDDRIIAFQFHLETTYDSATTIIKNCRSDIDDSLYVQNEVEMLSDMDKFKGINGVMSSILDVLEATS